MDSVSPMKGLSKSTRCIQSNRSSNKTTNHQRSLSAPKVIASRKQNSRPSSANHSRPASRSSNDQRDTSPPISAPQSDTDQSIFTSDAHPQSKRSRSRSNQRNNCPEKQRTVDPSVDRSASEKEDSFIASPGSSPSKANQRKPRRPRSQLSVVPPLIRLDDPSLSTMTEPSILEKQDLYSKSAPTASFLSRRANGKFSNPKATNKSAAYAPCSDWDMPSLQHKGNEPLTWQQTLLGGSRAVDDSTLASTSKSPTPVSTHQVPASASTLTFSKTVPQQPTSAQKSNLTWQQTLFNADQSPAPRSALVGRTSPTKPRPAGRRNRSKTDGSGSESATPSPLPALASLSMLADNTPVIEDSPAAPTAERIRSSSPKKPVVAAKNMNTTSHSSPASYAGPDFHNSPKPSDLPAPSTLRRPVVAPL